MNLNCRETAISKSAISHLERERIVSYEAWVNHDLRALGLPTEMDYMGYADADYAGVPVRVC